jgi:hypothetical protein
MIKPLLPASGMLLVLTLIFWAPALFWGQSVIHGDFVLDGLPLFDLLARAVRGEASLLWSAGLYGGHPLFAEGQGAFAHPVDLLVAGLVAPLTGTVHAANLFLWWCMLFGGIGTAGLGRSLGLSPWAAGFAALAVGFSGLWITELQNTTIAGTLAWAPWCMWAMEAWLRRPGLRSATLFGSTVALMVLAGYPQILHATLLYLLVTLLAGLFQPVQRRDWAARWRPLADTLAVAVLVGVGLGAIQWLPLLELAGQSHRQSGVQLISIPLEQSLRGFLYSDFGPAEVPSFPSVGSLLVCLLASLSLLVPAPSRLKAHIPATLLLLALGTDGGIFRLLYRFDLVPGLHYFRVVFPYLAVAIIGIGLSAGFAVDRVAGWVGSERPIRDAAPAPPAWRLGVLAVLWIGAVWWVGWRLVAPLEYAALLAAGAGGLALARFHRARRVPQFLALVLAAECLGLRTQCFEFASPDIFAKPASVAAIEALPDWRDYKTDNDTIAAAYAFRPPLSPGLASNVTRFLGCLGSLPNLDWDLASFGGALALPLRRRMLVDPMIEDEIRGGRSAPIGLRLIDLLGIRFVALDLPVSTAGFRPFLPPDRDRGWILENAAARPRFQIYPRHVAVDTPEQALAALAALSEPVLVIENPASTHLAEMADSAGSTPGSVDFEIVEATATSYRLKLSARAPAWLFLADANYPGWHARLDGADTPVFTAQLLGKAVAIPPGDHELVLRFDSETIRWGCCLSLGSVALALGLAGAGGRRPTSAG